VPVFGCDGVGAMLVDVGDGVVATVVEVVVEESVHAESIASTTRAMVLGAFMSAAS
jgi:hypothetical protein